jgi:hypothetical protein
MRDFFQTDRRADIGPVGDDRHNAAMIELERRAQHHQREQLMLRKILAAEPAGVGGKRRTLSDLDGLPGQRHRRPRHRSGGIHAEYVAERGP